MLAGFNPPESTACRRLVVLALEEDVGGFDLTSLVIIRPDLTGKAVFVARSAGIVAGLPAAAMVIEAVDTSLRFEPLIADGSPVIKGTRLAVVSGAMRSILAAERIALNFLQHLSGVASLTRRYVDAVAGLRAKILDTRKTLPGWRLLEKYAVRCGGGCNHRMGLFDGVLIKDNHLASLPMTDRRLQIEEAVRLVRSTAVGVFNPIEIEVDDLEQFDTALVCQPGIIPLDQPNIILLDNMSPETMREAVRRRDARAKDILLEASGGVNLQTVRAIAETGVDRISVGALTHSAPALDIALDYEK